MVLGLNGRMPLNTVGNLHARAIGDTTNVTGAGQNQTLGGSTISALIPAPTYTTQVNQPGPGNVTGVTPDSAYFLPNQSGVQGSQYTSQTYFDAPLWDHASHLGYSVNEINPKFALQNAPSNLYPAASQNIYGGYPLWNVGSGTFVGSNGNYQTFYTQYDNAGVSVALTQMRNILTGTIPTDIANPLSTSHLNSNGTVNFSGLTSANSDANVVVVNGQPYVLPNNVADFNDNNVANGSISRLRAAVAGRWGESSFVPQNLFFPSSSGVYNTRIFAELAPTGVLVQRGPTLDGIGKYLQDVITEAPDEPVDVATILRATTTDVVVSYLPVGSEVATRWYAEQALAAGCAFVNCIPVFIAADPAWRDRFARAGLPLIGDDIKSQVGATIVHRMLVNLFRERGVRVDRTYQLNFGGNADFMNMLERDRLESKKLSKTGAVTSQLADRLPDGSVHVGPSDHVPWLEDRKWAYIRLEGTTFVTCR